MVFLAFSKADSLLHDLDHKATFPAKPVTTCIQFLDTQVVNMNLSNQDTTA